MCNKCNSDRKNSGKEDHSVKVFKSALSTNIGLSRGRIKGRGGKANAAISRDNAFYKSLWESKAHYCEECGVYLGDDFSDENGRVIDRFRYSHILSKGAYPMFRHNPMNMNLLCLKDHERWHKRDVSMNIFDANSKVIEQLMSSING